MERLRLKQVKSRGEQGEAVTVPSPYVAPGFLSLILTGSSAAAPILIFIGALVAAIDRTFDLVSFLLSLASTLALGLAVWRSHTFYLILTNRIRRTSAPAQARAGDPLARFAALPLWHDPLILGLLAASLAANLSIFAYISASFATLPPFLPLHYSASGDVDRLGTPPEVFMMPGIGFVVLAANVLFGGLLYRGERLASCLLIGATVFVQLELLVATVQIVSRA